MFKITKIKNIPQIQQDERFIKYAVWTVVYIGTTMLEISVLHCKQQHALDRILIEEKASCVRICSM